MAQHRSTVEQSVGGAARRKLTNRALFTRGFVGLLPLWTGAIPVGVAYGLAARGAGLNAVETQVMSLLVFSAAAQVSAVALLDGGAPAIVLLATALLLNLQLLLLGLAAGRDARPSRLGKPLGAFFLTEGAYGVAVGSGGGKLTLPGLIGAGASMYVAWNLGTAFGVSVGDAIPNPVGIGIDLVAPLTFLAVLVPLVRTRPALVTALVAGATALLLARIVPTGVAVLVAGLGGSIAGAWSARDHDLDDAR
ncbi:MAG: AzlC family ABC transporter permease [Vicinamibacterales bacterium]